MLADVDSASLDAELGEHIEGKTEAEALAADYRSAITHGTFERAVDKRVREEREAAVVPERVATAAPTKEQPGPTY